MTRVGFGGLRAGLKAATRELGARERKVRGSRPTTSGVTAWRRRLLGTSRGVLPRVRAIALLGVLTSLVLTLPRLLVAGDGPLGLRLAVVLAALLLAAHWVRGARRGRFATWAELPELLVVLAVLAVAPGHPGLPLFVLLFRSLYGSARLSAVRAIALFATSTGVYVWMDGVQAHPLDRAIGLALASGVMAFLHRALERYDRVERRLHSLVENSSDVISIVGSDGRLQWQGGSIRRILGHVPQQLVGTPFLDLVHPGDAAEVERELRRAGDAPGASRTFTARLRHAEGSYRWMEAVVANLTHDRHVDGILLNLRDATERRRLEGERRVLARQRAADEARRVELERLHERVEAQREKQTLEERLQRSQRLESVGQLAGGVAHDFNNLLAIILNYAGFLRDELPDDAGLRADLHEIEQAAERGASLTRQLLLFAQRKVNQPEVLDVDAVVVELVQMLDRSLGHSIELRYERAAEPVLVEADRASLEQVVMNLVINARDALGAGGTVSASIRAVSVDQAEADGRELEPGPYVLLRVADDGCGMDEETLARAMGAVLQHEGRRQGHRPRPGHRLRGRHAGGRRGAAELAPRRGDDGRGPPPRHHEGSPGRRAPDGRGRCRRRRAHPRRGGRGSGPRRGRAPPRVVGPLRDPGGVGAARARPPARPGGAPRPPAHRRGDAGHDRPRARHAGPRHDARPGRPLHVGLQPGAAGGRDRGARPRALQAVRRADAAQRGGERAALP